MRPSRRVDLHLCPFDPDLEPPAGLAQLWVCWRGADVIDDAGGPGPNAGTLVGGGFVRLRVDRPGRVALYANAQGGFRASTSEGQVVTPVMFERAVRAAREGGPRTLTVEGREVALEALVYAPPAAWARWAVVIAGVESLEEGSAMAQAEALLGPLQRIARRVS